VPLWGDSIGLDVSEIGYVTSISSAVDAAMFIPAGYSLDHWGRKWTGAPSLAILALSLALLPLTENFATLAAVGVLAGIGNGLSSGLVLTMGADIAPKDAAGEFLGVWRLITDSGGAGGPLAVGAIAQALALWSACFATAGIGVAGAAVMLLLVKDTADFHRARPPPAKR
jgi:MFS family permease